MRVRARSFICVGGDDSGFEDWRADGNTAGAHARGTASAALHGLGVGTILPEERVGPRYDRRPACDTLDNLKLEIFSAETPRAIRTDGPPPAAHAREPT